MEGGFIREGGWLINSNETNSCDLTSQTYVYLTFEASLLKKPGLRFMISRMRLRQTSRDLVVGDCASQLSTEHACKLNFSR